MSRQGEMSPDMETLRARYAVERDRRAAAGGRRYRGLEEGFRDQPVDPYTPRRERAAVHDAVDALIIGGGFGGLLTAARLREAGVARIRIVETGGDFGGTWYWNRYPGAACDIESYIYLPLLEETDYIPLERYSKAAEIREHCSRIARHFSLYELALFSTQVTSLEWNVGSSTWDVGTDRNDRFTARFVVLSTGPLNKPKLADIPGLDQFKGYAFHTSRWDYAYTGGSATELMTGLADKRVGIIGTGATAVQCVPPLARSAQHLSVFQRTPSSVDARNNRATDPKWKASLTPGWQQRRMENFTAQMAGHFVEEDEVRDGWTVLARAVRARLAAGETADIAVMIAEADMKKMIEIRQRIDDIVEDPKTADALKPWFSLFCKRPCFHDEYLGVFNRPNVTLVDTQGRGVEAITERGVVADGQEYPLDCLIFATGFEVGTDFSRRAGFTARGVDGLTLTEKWKEGLSTLHGLQTRGFPNLFILSQAQSGMSPNFPHMLSEQSRHIAHLVGVCIDRGVLKLDVSAEAEKAWVETIVGSGSSRLKALEACTPGYYNNEGRPSEETIRSLPYGRGAVAFIELLRAWRERGDFAGLELDGRPVSPEPRSEAAQ